MIRSGMIRFTSILMLIFLVQVVNAQVPGGEIAGDSLIEIAQSRVDSLRDARNDRIDAATERFDRLSHVEFTMDFMNRVVYMGRNWGIRGSQVLLTAGYNHRTGVYGEITGYHLTKVPKSAQNDPVSPTLAQVDFTLGFRKQLLEGWNADVAYSYWWILYGTSVFRNELKNSFDLNTSYEYRNFLVTADVYFMWGKTSNVEVTFGLGKGFNIYHIFGNDRLTITPTFNVGAGSTTGMIKKYKPDTDPYSDSLANLGHFRLLNLEPALPIEYRIGPVDFTFAASLEIPRNIVDPAESTLGTKPFMLYQGTLKFFIGKKSGT